MIAIGDGMEKTYFLFVMGRCPKPRRSAGETPAILPSGSDAVAYNNGVLTQTPISLGLKISYYVLYLK